MRALALAAFIGLGCRPSEVQQPELVYPAEHVPQISLAHVGLAPGTSEHTVMVEGQPRTVVVVAPELLTRNHPLVVYLHGALSAGARPDNVVSALVRTNV